MIKKIILLLFFILLNCNIVNSQQIAKTDAIQSLENIMMIHYHNNMINPAEDIYNDIWNNSLINCYSKLSIIENTEIDLRDFHMPIDKKNILVTSKYGYRKQFKKNHYGVDLKVFTGDTIFSTFSGKIRIVKNEPKGYGKYIVIRHFNGLETIYGHLSKQLVKENEYVYAGQPIGLGGSTGRSTGSHLHLEIRYCNIKINPQKIFNFKFQDITNNIFQINQKKR